MNRVYSRNGRTWGVVVGSRHCTLEGCCGVRYCVRWTDGKRTWPCSKGMKERLSNVAQEAGPSPTRQYSNLPGGEKVGTLTILSGKTDDIQYVLTSKMSVIGKSDMASIKLKAWFAPKMAALISKRENGYFIAASEKRIKVKINDEEIAGQRALADGDVIEVAGIKMSFGFQT